MIRRANGYRQAALPTPRRALRLPEDAPPAAEAARELPRGLLRQPQGRSAPARRAALRRAPRQLRAREGSWRPRPPPGRDARRRAAAPRRGRTPPRLHLPRPRRRRFAPPARPHGPCLGGCPPGRAAAPPLRVLLPPLRRLAGGRARFRPQH